MQGPTVNDDRPLTGNAEALDRVPPALHQAPARDSRSTPRVPRAIGSGHSRDGARVDGMLRVRVDRRFEPE